MYTASELFVTAMGEHRPRRRCTARAKPLTALALVLSLGACSTVEDSWGWAFGTDAPAEAETDSGSTEGADAAAPAPEPAPEPARALVGAPSRPDYTEGGRRTPRSVRALVPAREDGNGPAPADSAPTAAPNAYDIGGGTPEPAETPPKETSPKDTSSEPATAPPQEDAVPAPATDAGTHTEGLPIAPPAKPADLSVRGAGIPAAAGTTVISSRGVAVEGRAPADGTAVPAALAPAPGAGRHVATIQFGHGSAALDARDRRILRQVKALMEERGGRLHVIGHASSRTGNMPMARHKMANFAVSVARAENVVAYLKRLGVPDAAVRFTALSDDDPAYYEVMPSGEAGNRRAEIYLEY